MQYRGIRELGIRVLGIQYLGICELGIQLPYPIHSWNFTIIFY